MSGQRLFLRRAAASEVALDNEPGARRTLRVRLHGVADQLEDAHLLDHAPMDRERLQPFLARCAARLRAPGSESDLVAIAASVDAAAEHLAEASETHGFLQRTADLLRDLARDAGAADAPAGDIPSADLPPRITLRAVAPVEEVAVIEGPPPPPLHPPAEEPQPVVEGRLAQARQALEWTKREWHRLEAEVAALRDQRESMEAELRSVHEALELSRAALHDAEDRRREARERWHSEMSRLRDVVVQGAEVFAD